MVKLIIPSQEYARWVSNEKEVLLLTPAASSDTQSSTCLQPCHCNAASSQLGHFKMQKEYLVSPADGEALEGDSLDTFSGEKNERIST